MQSKSSILWNCRRGKLELDIMLQRFMEQRFDDLESSGVVEFERFLDLPDEVMLDYLLAREEPSDPSIARITRLIRECN